MNFVPQIAMGLIVVQNPGTLILYYYYVMLLMPSNSTYQNPAHWNLQFLMIESCSSK